MSQVQLTINFTVAQGQGGSPLVLTPPSPVNENLTVGVPVDGVVVATVSGGTGPYSYTVDPASGLLPPGVTLQENNGVISLAGTPTTVGSGAPFLLNIVDAGGAKAQLGVNTSVRTIR